MKRGADVNKRGKDQETALHCAVSRDHASTVWLLLDQGIVFFLGGGGRQGERRSVST